MSYWVGLVGEASKLHVNVMYTDLVQKLAKYTRNECTN